MYSVAMFQQGNLGQCPYGSFKTIFLNTMGVVMYFVNLPEDPAFSTGGRPIFKCKYPCIGSTYSRNQNRFRIYNLSSIKLNLTLDYQMPE